MSANPFNHVDKKRLREGSGVKWGAVDEDVSPAWVADMDFGAPPAVRARLLEAVEREDFGYPHWPAGDPVVAAFEDRMSARFGWDVRRGRVRLFSDLIQILQVVIEQATEPGDGVAMHVPTYPPFLASIQRAGRRIVPIPMVEVNGAWTFEAQDLAQKWLDERVRLVVLVNPHNPTGRAFSEEELRAVADAACAVDAIVLADEIHADLVHQPSQHIPFASLGPDEARRTVTATSPTKTFNIAGLRCAVAHVGADSLWASLEKAPLDYFGTPSTLSRVATVAAWNESDDWHASLLQHLRNNRDVVTDWARQSPFGIGHIPPDATYLSWIDLAPAGIGRFPAASILEHGRVLLSEGADFSAGTGVDTDSFVRINFATSEAHLLQVLAGIDKALHHGRAD